jgi:hypothetical protein
MARIETLALALLPLKTRVCDPAFLCDTTRAFARWELAWFVQLPPEDTVASCGGGEGVRPGAEDMTPGTFRLASL